MTEYLALPAWDTQPRPLDDWVRALTEAGAPTTVEHEGRDEVWLEVAPIRVRGYVVIEGIGVTAINFELHDPETEPALAIVTTAAKSLGYEVHADDGEDDED